VQQTLPENGDVNTILLADSAYRFSGTACLPGSDSALGAAVAREFGLTASEQALISPIFADWQAKNSAIAEQSRKASEGGRITKSSELDALESTRRKAIADYIDQLQAALGPERFKALDATVSAGNFPRANSGGQAVLTVVDVNGRSTQVKFAGMAYEPLRRPGRSHMAALTVYTREGIEQFGWETVSKVEISAGRATIALRTGEKVAATELPPHSSLTGQTNGGGRAEIDFSRIKTITVSP